MNKSSYKKAMESIGEDTGEDCYFYVCKMKIADKTIIKVGKTEQEPKKRFEELHRNFGATTLDIMVLAKSPKASSIENKFLGENKSKKLEDVNSNTFNKSRESFPYNDDMICDLIRFLEKEKNNFNKLFKSQEIISEENKLNKFKKESNEVKKLKKTTLTSSKKYIDENKIPAKRISKQTKFYLHE